MKKMRSLLLFVFFMSFVLTLNPIQASELQQEPTVRQWASSAVASSEWGTTSWAAFQATGVPDAYPECYDNALAWAPRTISEDDWLEVYYETAVIPSQINIYLTYQPGFIGTVELLPADGSAAIVIPNSSDPLTDCPHIFQLNITLPNLPLINGVRINLDRTMGLGWNEIDAVELVSGPVGNTPPIAEVDNYTTPFGTTLDVPSATGVLSNDIDAEGDILTASLVVGPDNAASFNLNADGSFTYVPAAGFWGSDRFTYQASDIEFTSNTASVSILVEDPLPEANNDAYATRIDAPLNVSAVNGVLANDVNLTGDPLSVSLVSSTTNGMLALNADGSFSYTPNAGFEGADSFVYIAVDSDSTSNEAVATISVTDGIPGGLEVGGNTTVGTILPTFEWILGVDEDGNPLPVEWINFVLIDATGNILLDIWFPYDRYCVGLYCSFTLTEQHLAAGLLSEGYSWAVRTWSVETGVTEFSSVAEFEITVPPPVVPDNIVVLVEGGQIIISWDDDTASAWYQIIIIDDTGTFVFIGWLHRTDLNCDGMRCTFIPPVDPASGALVNGSYTVYIQAWGAGGFNGGNADNFSGGDDFTVDAPPTGPVDVTTFAITNTKSGSPTFRWTPAENATWHLIWIGNLDMLLTRHARWYPVSAMDCPEGIRNPCTITPSDIFLTVEDYDYNVWILSWGPGNDEDDLGQFGPWVELTTFRVEVDPPGKAVPLTPTNTAVNTGVPIFQWHHVPDVTWYNVWIGTYDSQTQVYTQFHYQWHRATDIGCLSTGVCTIDPPDLYLPEADNYYWWILTYNPAYDQNNPNWSDPGQFAVDRP